MELFVGLFVCEALVIESIKKTVKWREICENMMGLRVMLCAFNCHYVYTLPLECVSAQRELEKRAENRMLYDDLEVVKSLSIDICW